MSSPEFATLRGISATATAARTAILTDPAKRNLIWWIQGKSIMEGGLQKFTEQIIDAFPDRISDVDLARRGHRILDIYGRRSGTRSLEEFLIDLCINPRLMIVLDSKAEDSTPGEDAEREMAKNRYRDLDDYSFRAAELPYFKNIIASLFELQRREQKTTKVNFVLTAIGRKVWKTMDFALSSGRMVLINGREGRGKSEAAKAWCEAHRGAARFVSLKGTCNKTTAFREIARALGIASGYGYKSTEFQARIEDVLQRSKLLLVLDEAHFAFSQSPRITTRPELIDWIDTALCNNGVPVALVTTPHFIDCMTRAAVQVGWNYLQFRRRVKRYVKLPEKNTREDIEAVIRGVLPGAPASAVKQVLSFVLLSKKDLSAVGDVVDELKDLQGCERCKPLSKVTYEQVLTVIEEHLQPSEKDFAESIKEAEDKLRSKSKRREVAPALDVAAALDDIAEAEIDADRASNLEQPARLRTPMNLVPS